MNARARKTTKKGVYCLSRLSLELIHFHLFVLPLSIPSILANRVGAKGELITEWKWSTTPRGPPFLGRSHREREAHTYTHTQNDNAIYIKSVTQTHKWKAYMCKKPHAFCSCITGVMRWEEEEIPRENNPYSTSHHLHPPALGGRDLRREESGRKEGRRLRRKKGREGGQKPREEGCVESVAPGSETHNGPILPVIPSFLSSPPISLSFLSFHLLFHSLPLISFAPPPPSFPNISYPLPFITSPLLSLGHL